MTWEEIKPKLWEILKPAIIAMIVALLVHLGVGDGAGLQVQGVSHFSSVYSNDDVQAVDDVIAGDDVTVGGDLTATGIVYAEHFDTSDDAVVDDDLTVSGVAYLEGDVTISGAATLESTLDMQGNIADSTGSVGIADNVLIDGASNAIQLQVQGYSTQTGGLLNLETSAGTDVLTATVDGSLFATGDVSIEDNLRFIQESALTVCAGCPITPTATYMQITASAWVTTSTSTAIVDGTYVGEVLWLVNSGSNNIDVDNGANTDLGSAGQITLGGTDVLAVLWNGTDWLRLWNTDN